MSKRLQTLRRGSESKGVLRCMNWGWGLGRCWSCGDPLVPNEVAGVCPPCRWEWPALDDAPSAQLLAAERTGSVAWGVGFRLRHGTGHTAYNQDVLDAMGPTGSGTHAVVHRMKYGGFPRVGRELGKWLAKRWRAPPDNAVLVPVPLHWRRRWRRGFNPPQALAEGLAKEWTRVVLPEAMVRTRHRVSLTHASRTARLEALEATYHMNAVVPFDEDDDQAKPPVVLVDDVLTTGATFRVCRKVLEEAGHEVLGGVWLALA